MMYLEQIFKKINKKKLNSEQVCKFYVDRILKSRKLNCFVNYDFENVIELSKKFDQRKNIKKKFKGIPIAFKDCFFSKNIQSHIQNSSIKKKFYKKTSKIVSNFEKNGGIFLGNIKINQFLTGSNKLKDDPINPITKKPDLIGSSHGCAAAVLANLSPAIVSTDVGGSTREPSAQLGLIGYKSSKNLLSNLNSLNISDALCAPGIISKNVADCALLLENIQCKNSKNINYYQKLKLVKNLKVAFVCNNFAGDVYFNKSHDVMKNISKAIGFKIYEINLKNISKNLEIYNLLLNKDFFKNFSTFLKNKKNLKNNKFYRSILQENLTNDVVRRFVLGKYVNDNYKQFEINSKINNFLKIKHYEINKYFASYDAIIYPVNLENKNDNNYKKIKVLANLLGLPCLVIPISKNGQNQIQSVEIIVKHNNDQLLLNIAHSFEKILDFKLKISDWWMNK